MFLGGALTGVMLHGIAAAWQLGCGLVLADMLFAASLRSLQAPLRCLAVAAELTGAEFLLRFIIFQGEAVPQPAHFFLWLACAAPVAALHRYGETNKKSF